MIQVIMMIKASFSVRCMTFLNFFIINHIIQKALVILNHSRSRFLLLTCLYGKKTFVGLCVTFWSIFMRKNSPSDYLTMTTRGQIYSCPDYCKTKWNVNIKLLDLCESLIVYILLGTFQWFHLTKAINRPDILLM